MTNDQANSFLQPSHYWRQCAILLPIIALLSWQSPINLSSGVAAFVMGLFGAGLWWQVWRKYGIAYDPIWTKISLLFGFCVAAAFQRDPAHMNTLPGALACSAAILSILLGYNLGVGLLTSAGLVRGEQGGGAQTRSGPK